MKQLSALRLKLSPEPESRYRQQMNGKIRDYERQLIHTQHLSGARWKLKNQYHRQQNKQYYKSFHCTSIRSYSCIGHVPCSRKYSHRYQGSTKLSANYNYINHVKYLLGVVNVENNIIKNNMLDKNKKTCIQNKCIHIHIFACLICYSEHEKDFIHFIDGSVHVVDLYLHVHLFNLYLI
jgi:hypothetical protein